MGRNKKTRVVHEYNTETFINELNRFSVDLFKNENGTYTVSTYFDNELVKSKTFKSYDNLPDFNKFVQYVLSKLAGEFEIFKFIAELNSTVQQIILLSDEIKIDGEKYHKAFYIVNSTDRTRVLNLDYGLYHIETGISFVTNDIFDKKDFKGGLKNNRVSSLDYGKINFDSITDMVRSTSNGYVRLSDVRNVILETKFGKINKSNHLKFDFLRLRLLDIPLSTTVEQARLIRTKSEDMEFTSENDIIFSAKDILFNYMYLYSSRDSFIIKNETKNMYDMVAYVIQNEVSVS